MRNIETGQSVDFTGSALGLVAIVLVMTLSGAAASSASQPRGASGMTASPEASTGASATEVMIDHFAFTPGVVTVRAGTQVTWINHDDIPHTVDSTQGKFKSAALDTDDKFSFTFSDSGAYGYFCSVHPVMTGKVIVK